MSAEPKTCRFQREPDGSVIVTATAWVTAFTAQEWAEAVASVTRRGAEAAEDALTLHTMEGGDRELSAAEMADAVRRSLKG